VATLKRHGPAAVPRALWLAPLFASPVMNTLPNHRSAQAHRPRPDAGFTLIELALVVFIIGILAAVAYPRLGYIIAYSELESGARRLANYGRAAMAEAAMMRQEMKIVFDLHEQQYYAMRLVYPEANEGEMAMEGEAPGDEDQLSKLMEYRQRQDLSAEDLADMLSEGGLPEDFDPEAADAQMSDRFNRFALQTLRTRAKNVIHDEGLFEDADIFDDREFSVGDDLEPVEEEVSLPVLARSSIPEGAAIESVEIDGEVKSRGKVEVPLTPLGLQSEVRIYISNEDGDVFTVRWDPVSNTTNVTEGRESGES